MTSAVAETLACVCVREGDPTQPVGGGTLDLRPHPLPPLGRNHVQIALQAASLNFADALLIQGKYQVKMKPPFVPGSEGAGVVTRVGEGVRNMQPGDRVVAFSQGGMFARDCVVHESTIWKVPDGVDLKLAAAVPVVYGTADLALRHRARLAAGQTVLVLGAGGGVGVAAVQIAKVAGARVIAVTQGASKAAFLRAQGADVVLDLADAADAAPLHARVKAVLRSGVDVVIDPVGGPLFGEALKCVAWGAQLVVIGFASGPIPQIPANILLVKNLTVHGLFWGSHLQHSPGVLRRSMDDILAWLAAGRITPHVSHTFALDQVPEAVRTLLNRQAMGKVVVNVQGQAGRAKPSVPPAAKL